MREKEVIEKLIRGTKDKKIWWNKYIHPKTYNFNYVTEIKGYKFILIAKRDKRDFFTITKLSLLFKEEFLISKEDDYARLFELMSLADKQEKEISADLEQFINDFLKK